MANKMICPTYIDTLTTDPFLNHMEWYPEACRFMSEVIQNTSNWDLELMKKKRPELYSAIEHLEYLIHEKGDGELSQIVWLLREWRELVLKAEFESKETNANANER